ncbi:iron uptake system protein EfeO [Phyllobacterium sp. YR531]|uniref:iron uptake system protein EfeO n=1 Tax=Phyllobacterium sp. YR531 TaxID=1144343 RepID=UPI00026FB2AF|nr:iron uptake system protein EfeO [Phyllobacterium sp. YR531]EJN00458.1 putative periplasmic lipoprotein involved in iron transport [Phyllobacterium sp. YR531]
MTSKTGPASTPPSQKLMKLAVAGAAILAVAGAGAFYFASKNMKSGTPDNAVVVTIKDGTCDPNAITVPAGRSTFKIINNSDRALEWEILDGVMVLEERENILPGFTQTMQAKLKAGDYEITCGLLSSPRGTLRVTPSAESEAEAARPPLVSFVGALAEFQVFLMTQTNSLVKAVTAMDEAIKAGDLEKARELYQKARAPYKQIEPMADLFADLHNAIDPIADYLEKREQDPAFTGFHRIEFGLYSSNSLDGLAPVSAKLLADVTALKDRVRGLRIPPEQIAKGAARLMGSIADTKIAAGEDHYSKTDLLDFEANLAGTSRMMALLKPVAAPAAPTVVADIETRLAEANTALAALRGTDGYPAYDKVTKDSRDVLAQKMKALADSIDKLNTAVGLE